MSYYQDAKDKQFNASFDTERSVDEVEVSKLIEIIKKKDLELSEKKSLYSTKKNEYQRTLSQLSLKTKEEKAKARDKLK